ncbi:UNVERIFIED_CONTAM: hypothetical protein FKN15_005582 [Acipenser sinensis]
MSGFHRCVTCGTKLPANDPHEDCVSCLGPEHAASALADKAFCTSCASFQTRTLRRRARRAVGDRSPSSGSSHTLSAPQPSLASPPPKLPISRSSSSQVTAGQRSPDARRKRDRSHSPPVMRGPSPRGERPQISRSRSGSPRRRGRSRSPRRDRRGGVTELTNKMSQFMDLMMGQQSLLMSLATARAAEEPVRPVVNQPIILPQPLSVPVAQQDAWDVDAISRDASEESEMEVGVDDSLWSLVERATRHLGLEWPATEEPRRSLFESPLAQGQQSRTLPAFPDFVKEVQSTWGTPASAPATSRKAAAFTMQGASEAGLASFPPVGTAFAALVKSPTLSGLVKDPTCPNKQCRITEVHLKKGYSAATEAVRLSNLASLLSVYQAALIKDLPDYPSVSLRAELGLIAQLLPAFCQPDPGIPQLFRMEVKLEVLPSSSIKRKKPWPRFSWLGQPPQSVLQSHDSQHSVSSCASVNDLMRQRFSVTSHTRLPYLIVSDGYMVTVIRVSSNSSPSAFINSILVDTTQRLEKARHTLLAAQTNPMMAALSPSESAVDGGRLEFASVFDTIHANPDSAADTCDTFTELGRVQRNLLTVWSVGVSLGRVEQKDLRLRHTIRCFVRFAHLIQFMDCPLPASIETFGDRVLKRALKKDLWIYGHGSQAMLWSDS